MDYRETWNLSSIPEEKFVQERNRRVAAKRKKPPRAKVLKPCPKCGKEFGVRDMRKHIPGCGSSP